MNVKYISIVMTLGMRPFSGESMMIPLKIFSVSLLQFDSDAI